MIGFLIGTACLIGLAKVLRCRRFAHGGGCGGCHGGRGWYVHGSMRPARGWGFGRGALVRHLFERLDTTPGQEKAIVAALEQLQTAMQKLRPASKGFSDLASALRAESFDEGSAAKFNVEAEQMFNSAKSAVIDALRKVHEVLDARQRGILADLIEQRAGGLFGGFRPYRGCHAGWV